MTNRNSIEITKVFCNDNTVSYEYNVKGQWIEVFNLSKKLFVEYDISINNCPASIAVIPLLANILPIAWICDAEIIVDECDKDFYESIPNFKKGYIEMYPMIDFKGDIRAGKLIDNTSATSNQTNSACFFSGGVDAFNTFFQHENEKPELITIWGADVKLYDIFGWKKVLNHTKKTSKEFNVSYRIIKSNFRNFISEGICNSLVQKSSDLWWHGFQNGLGMIGLSAPIAYVDNLKKIYFASSYTEEEREFVTCASDPTIDNYIRFCKVQVIHDGYELNRQEKVRNIISFAENRQTDVNVRVCWQSKGGKNCCKCEKCWRTIFEILAENGDPKKFGFDYSNRLAKNSRKVYYHNLSNLPSDKSWYRVSQQTMRNNRDINSLPKGLRWFYETEVDDFWNKSPRYFELLQQLKYKIKRPLALLKRYLIKKLTH